MQPGTLTRRAEFGAGVDLAARSVPVVVATSTPVPRGDVLEVLDMTRVDLSRGDLPLIESHDATRVNIGIVRSLRVDGDKLRGVAVFGTSARALELLRDIHDGIVTGVSVGYAHTDAGVDFSMPDGRLARSYGFMPYEVSVVAVPADTAAGFNRSHTPTGARPMQTAPAADAGEIRYLARGLPEAFADGLIAAGATLDIARAAVLAELARRDTAAGGHRNVAPVDHFARRATDIEQARSQMIAVLAARMGAPIDVSANQYRGARLVDMARDHLELRGVRTSGMSATELIKRAMHGTGDFAGLLVESGNRVLASRFATYQGGLRRAARQTTIPDFRPKSTLRLGEAPKLLKVNEHGEFRYGSMIESKEGYALATYGRIFSITRQAIVNDDLGAFNDVIGAFAQSAYELENTQLVDLLTSNSGAGPTMGDALPLFHADHGNLATGAGSALSETSLAAARAAMRLQKGLDKLTPIDATPRFLIVPAALENTAMKLTTATTPATSSDVNPTGRGLEVVVDPRLDAKSATAWYLAADPTSLAGLEYAYLEGDQGPVIEQDYGFDVDGVSYKCRLDFGCGVLDFRGLYRAAGA